RLARGGLGGARAELRQTPPPRPPTPARRGGAFPRHCLDRARRAFGAGGAGACVRPALPGLSVRTDHRRDSSAFARDEKARGQRETRGEVEAALTSPGGGNRGGGHTGSVGGLHRLQRKFRQLAGGVVLGRFARARVHSAAGTGRAKLSMSSAAATPARLALCSTRPNAVAASATATNRIDGRSRLSN